METLRPVEINDYHIKKIATGMSKYFWDYIFKEIFVILKDNAVSNSKDDLIKAIKSGRIWYDNGVFKTRDIFSNNIAKILEEMGARYLRNGYHIERTKIPFDIIQSIDFVKTQSILKATRLEQFLAGLTPALEKLTVADYIKYATERMFKGLQLDILKSAQEKKLPIVELGLNIPEVKTSWFQRKAIEAYWKKQDKQADILRKKINKATDDVQREQLREQLLEHQKKAFENAPQIELKLENTELDEQTAKITQDYVNNMNYWVKKWEVKNIVKMRQDVMKMVQKGVRVPELAEYFEKRWKVAKDKALFLATNESHLAGSVIQATQYQKLGCTHFKWGRSTSKEKRELHKLYYDQIFSFDNPPIIDEKLGIRGLPRQIWNCKCLMLCVVPSFAERLQQKEEVQNAKRNIFKYFKYRIQNNKQRNNNAWRYRQFG